MIFFVRKEKSHLSLLLSIIHYENSEKIFFLFDQPYSSAPTIQRGIAHLSNIK